MKKFFLDNNQPQQLARLIEAFDTTSEVRHLTDRFVNTTPDTDTVLDDDLAHCQQSKPARTTTAVAHADGDIGIDPFGVVESLQP